MTYPWQLAEFPSDGTLPTTEITWKHFETLRRAIWLILHIDCGIQPPSYTSSNCTTQSTWEAFVDSTFTSEALFPLDGPLSQLINISYINTTTRPAVTCIPFTERRRIGRR